MSNQKYLWKAMRKNLYSYYKRKKWKLGKWYKAKGELSMCRHGFHASERIIDSMKYVPMEFLGKVEVKGDNLKQSDKQCWSEMRVIKAWKWGKEDSVALSIYAASLVLENFEKKYPDDKRPRQAIQVAREWLKNSTKKNQSAVWSAARSAWSAARSAAESAWSAAESAGAAAESAWSAGSAGAAAGAAANQNLLNRIEKWIHRKIKKLEEIK